MKKMLNTLYVTKENAYLFKDGETVAVKIEDQVRLRVPLHTLDSIVCFGSVAMSPFLMGHCAEKDVAVSFMTSNGRFLAKVQGPVSGNVLLRREQYRYADDDDESVFIARSFLIGKISNALTVIGRALRDHKAKVDSAALQTVQADLKRDLQKIRSENELDRLRGIEGRSANRYFSVFDHLIVTQKKAFKFNNRNRRPPLDAVNCLLSFIYTLLYHDARSALESVGLDPAVGFLHRDRPGRMSLALDLMEELRPVLADRLTLSLINLAQVKENGFTKSESGAVLMDDDTRKLVLTAYQERKREKVLHRFLQENISIGLILFAQARLLARYIRGDLDGYPPYIWK